MCGRYGAFEGDDSKTGDQRSDWRSDPVEGVYKSFLSVPSTRKKSKHTAIKTVVGKNNFNIITMGKKSDHLTSTILLIFWLKM